MAVSSYQYYAVTNYAALIYTKIEERSTTVCCTDINLRADKSTLTEPVQEEER